MHPPLCHRPVTLGPYCVLNHSVSSGCAGRRDISLCEMQVVEVAAGQLLYNGLVPLLQGLTTFQNSGPHLQQWRGASVTRGFLDSPRIRGD